MKSNESLAKSGSESPSSTPSRNTFVMRSPFVDGVGSNQLLDTLYHQSRAPTTTTSQHSASAENNSLNHIKSTSIPMLNLRLLVVSDVGGSLVNVARLSSWLVQRGMEHQIDLVLCAGLCHHHVDSYTNNNNNTHHQLYPSSTRSKCSSSSSSIDSLEHHHHSTSSNSTNAQNNQHLQMISTDGECSATIAALENICPRVVYTPGRGDSHALYQGVLSPDSSSGISQSASGTIRRAARLTPQSYNICGRALRLDYNLIIGDSLAVSIHKELLMRERGILARRVATWSELHASQVHKSDQSASIRSNEGEDIATEKFLRQFQLVSQDTRNSLIAWQPWGNFLWLSVKSPVRDILQIAASELPSAPDPAKLISCQKCTTSADLKDGRDSVIDTAKETMTLKPTSLRNGRHSRRGFMEELASTQHPQHWVVLETYVSDFVHVPKVKEQKNTLNSEAPPRSEISPMLSKVYLDGLSQSRNASKATHHHHYHHSRQNESVHHENSGVQREFKSSASNSSSLSSSTAATLLRVLVDYQPGASVRDGRVNFKQSIAESGHNSKGWTNVELDPGALREGSFGLVELQKPLRARECPRCRIRIHKSSTNSIDQQNCSCWRITNANVHRLG